MVKNLTADAGDLGLIPGSGRCPGEGNDNPLQYSCLENSMERGDWWATVHGSQESDTTRQLNHHKYIMRMVANERIQLRKREIKDYFLKI